MRTNLRTNPPFKVGDTIDFSSGSMETKLPRYFSLPSYQNNGLSLGPTFRRIVDISIQRFQNILVELSGSATSKIQCGFEYNIKANPSSTEWLPVFESVSFLVR